ncbi:ABC transporter ATP-binding protein [Microbacterium sp. ABRD28]|uniref:ABC transporter ATP-binding protein n=1 Tax=Microbacterium sp. ABRD28 TaxID=2268461 RepID=UPI001F0CB9EF|nr:ABC transporter ATP-binding protein [Microbacterium sp. ABRD28]
MHGATIDIPSGAVAGFVGPNGSGKSTLLRTVYRAVAPVSGTVAVGDRDVRSVTARQAAKAVAVMLQEAVLDFDLTVEETVLLGRAPHRTTFGRDTSADRRIVAHALRRAEIEDLSDRMVASLSGGQRQRVMLARALAQQTPVLILDEPSNHLDISHQHDLMTTVRSLGATVIVALHDLNLAARYCDLVVVLAEGRVIASGSPSDVLTVDLIRSTFGVDARILSDGREKVFAFRPLERTVTGVLSHP